MTTAVTKPELDAKARAAELLEEIESPLTTADRRRQIAEQMLAENPDPFLIVCRILLAGQINPKQQNPEGI